MKKEETGTHIRLSEDTDTHNSLGEYTHKELSDLISEGKENLSDIILFTDDSTQEPVIDIFVFTGEEQAPLAQTNTQSGFNSERRDLYGNQRGSCNRQKIQEAS